MNRLKQLRLDRGLTMTEVEAATGVSKQSISKIETTNSGGPATLKALGDFFGVRASSLLMPAVDAEDVAA